MTFSDTSVSAFSENFSAAQNGHKGAIARLLSYIEEQGGAALQHEELLGERRAFRLGFTGPPGVGKSTLINRLLFLLAAKGLRLAVLAVDPTSPFTKGALLGDRIRYTQAHDRSVFVRSIGSRGSLGGVSASVYGMLRVFDALGWDGVLLETVGVGQVELEVMDVVDQVGVVLGPESGDGIQLLKTGLMEIAHFFVVNKSDRPGAKAFREELNLVTSRPIFSTAAQPMAAQPMAAQPTAAQSTEAQPMVAHQDEGMELTALSTHLKQLLQEKKCLPATPERLQAEARALLRAAHEQQMEQKISFIKTPQDLSSFFR